MTIIRIILEKASYVAWNGQRVPARVDVREFTDVAEAANWLIEDSYFSESYTRSVRWERIDTGE